MWSGGGPVAWWARLPALALVAMILAQGAFYWHVKLGSVRRGVPLPAAYCRLLRGLRASALGGFVAAVGGTGAAYLAGPGRIVDLACRGALLAFAALEYVNYYHWQLEHDSAADWAYLLRFRRLRRAPLAMDLARICRDPR